MESFEAMSETDRLSRSLADYIETIYRLVQERQATRVKDIADGMHVQMPSVTGALKVLAERGLVLHAPYSPVTLTPRGVRLAEEILHSHQVLSEFFGTVLGMDPESADRNACEVEHAIEPEALDRLVRFLQFLERCPRTGAAWLRGLYHFCEPPPSADECRRCIDSMREAGTDPASAPAPLPQPETAL